MDELALTPARGAELLRGLMQVLFLSAACASGHHPECPGVDEYSSLVCCCTECEHSDLSERKPSPPFAGIPLLHLVVDDEAPSPFHLYCQGEPLGVRIDLVRALEKALRDSPAQVPPAQVRDSAVQLGVAACLTFAPRRL